MGRLIFILTTLFFFACQPKNYSSFLQNDEAVLSLPIVVVDSVLFQQQAVFRMFPPLAAAEIRYTTNGKTVKLDSPLCKDSLVFIGNTDLQFRAFYGDFIPSETLLYSVRKVSNDGRMNILDGSTLPKTPYEGTGLNALSDLKKGGLDFRSNAHWLGYQEKVIELYLKFDNATFCEQISLSILADYNSWIFTPSKLELVYNEMVIAERMIDAPIEDDGACLKFIDFPVGVSVKEATLKIYMDDIPDWHVGKGSVPWFFIDEVFCSFEF